MISESLIPGGGIRRPRQLGRWKDTSVFNFRHIFPLRPLPDLADGFQDPRATLCGMPYVIHRSESQLLFRQRVVEAEPEHQAYWNRHLRPEDGQDVIWFGWAARGQASPEGQFVLQGCMMVGSGNDLIENAQSGEGPPVSPGSIIRVQVSLGEFLDVLEDIFERGASADPFWYAASLAQSQPAVAPTKPEWND